MDNFLGEGFPRIRHVAFNGGAHTMSDRRITMKVILVSQDRELHQVCRAALRPVFD